MKHNILAPLVFFFMTLTCLLVIDDMANKKAKSSTEQDLVKVAESENPSDLISIDDME